MHPSHKLWIIRHLTPLGKLQRWQYCSQIFELMASYFCIVETRKKLYSCQCSKKCPQNLKRKKLVFLIKTSGIICEHKVEKGQRPQNSTEEQLSPQTQTLDTSPEKRYRIQKRSVLKDAIFMQPDPTPTKEEMTYPSLNRNLFG